MRIEPVDTLKRGLRRTRNYQRFWGHYLDHFAANPEFHELGQPVEDPALKTALAQAGAKRLHRRKSKMLGLEFREIPEIGLVHGICFLDGRLATFLFSREDCAGILALTSLWTDRVMFTRFTMARQARMAAA